MGEDKDKVIPPQKVEKEPWETPRVVVAAVKEATAYYTQTDDIPAQS